MQHIIILTSLIVLVLVLYFTNIRCPFRAVTGIPCPGCGLSRAVFSAAALNFKAAFSYHPLFFLAPFYLFAAIHYDTPLFSGKWRRVVKWFIVLSTLLFLAVYVYRLIFHMIP